jgi:hypothetical protein
VEDQLCNHLNKNCKCNVLLHKVLHQNDLLLLLLKNNPPSVQCSEQCSVEALQLKLQNVKKLKLKNKLIMILLNLKCIPHWNLQIKQLWWWKRVNLIKCRKHRMECKNAWPWIANKKLMTYSLDLRLNTKNWKSLMLWNQKTWWAQKLEWLVQQFQFRLQLLQRFYHHFKA